MSCPSLTIILLPTIGVQMTPNALQAPTLPTSALNRHSYIGPNALTGPTLSDFHQKTTLCAVYDLEPNALTVPNSTNFDQIPPPPLYSARTQSWSQAPKCSGYQGREWKEQLLGTVRSFINIKNSGISHTTAQRRRESSSPENALKPRHFVHT